MEYSIGSQAEDEMRPWLVGVTASMAALSVVFVSLRILSRRLGQQKLWWDDYLILVSAVSFNNLPLKAKKSLALYS